MHISDRDKLLNTLGGDMVTAPLTWHDYRQPRLKLAFAGLRRYSAVITRKPYYRRWYNIALPATYAAITALMNMSFMPVLIMAAGTTILYLIVDGVLPRRARKHFHELALVVRRGDFGHAMMWDDEPAWELLETALQHNGIDIREIFRDPALNKRVTPVIAEMLEETWLTRCKLSELGAGLPYANPAMVVLADAASRVVMTIYSIRSSHLAQQRL